MNILTTVYIITTLVLLGVIFFLLFYIKLLKTKLQDSNKQPKEISANENNSLGHFFSENTKSLSIAIKKDGKILNANEALLELLGYTKKQLIGKNIYGTLLASISRNEPLEMNIITRIFKNPAFYTENETELITKSGKKVYISWTNRLIKDKNGKATELRGVGFDITERKSLEQELQFIASKDPQTGVLNRLALIENGTRELKRSIRYKHDFSVLALRLLSINKNLTSSQIENLLNMVVSICRKTIRDVDYLGRIGEAEFILLLPETAEKNLPFLEKRLEEKIIEYNRKYSQFPIQVSFGKAAYNTKTRTIDDLISKALSNIKKRKTK